MLPETFLLCYFNLVETYGNLNKRSYGTKEISDDGANTDAEIPLGGGKGFGGVHENTHKCGGNREFSQQPKD